MGQNATECCFVADPVSVILTKAGRLPCELSYRLRLFATLYHGELMDLKRRSFVAFLSAALAARSIPTNAEQATRLRTIGVLMGLANDEQTQARVKVIEQGLAKKGWIVGQNLHMEYRYAASDIGRMQSLSEELVALQPDVIIGHSTPVVAALLKVTHSIPIVFVVVADPVGSGFVASLARPAGNVTGFSNPVPTITGKYLSILRDLKPQLTRVALMYNPRVRPRRWNTFYARVHGISEGISCHPDRN